MNRIFGNVRRKIRRTVMNRKEERNMIAHEIAWETSKHYDPLLSKESWCEMAAREAIDWADEHPKKGLVDIDKVCQWLRYYRWKYEDSREGNEIMEKDIRKAMEE